MPTPSAFSAFASRRARRCASRYVYLWSEPSSTVFETISVSPWCRSACSIRLLIKSGMSIIRPCIPPPDCSSCLWHLNLAAAPAGRQAALRNDDRRGGLAAQLLQLLHGALDRGLGRGTERLGRLFQGLRLE